MAEIRITSFPFAGVETVHVLVAQIKLPNFKCSTDSSFFSVIAEQLEFQIRESSLSQQVLIFSLEYN